MRSVNSPEALLPPITKQFAAHALELNKAFPELVDRRPNLQIDKSELPLSSVGSLC